MSTLATTMTIELPPGTRPLLDSLAGETPDQKIVHLLLGEVRRHLEACERERLELEIKYGMEYDSFQQKLEAGQFGDEFNYELEMDAIRWGDLIAEKRHWLQQSSLLKGLLT